MKKMIILVVLFMFIGSATLLASTLKRSTTKMSKNITLGSQKKVKVATQKPSAVFRVCCSVSLYSETMGWIGATSCAGSIFTSCEDAGERACEKVAIKAMKAAFDTN